MMEEQSQQGTENIEVATNHQKKKKRRKRRKRRWSFPTVSKCPRCGSTNTICRRTDIQNGWQYRQCRQAICRKNYPVKGEKI